MLFRIFKYAIKNILRNTFLSISSILVLTLLMFFINVLGLLENVGNKLIEGINSKMTISLYIDSQYSKNSLEVSTLMEEIENFQGDVSVEDKVKIEYKTKERILNEIRQKEPNLVNILEKDNPLPDTIIVSNVGIEDYETLNTIIGSKMFVLINDKSDKEFFANYTTQYKKIQSVISTLNILRMGLNIIIAVFFISIAIIIYSVISNFVYYYRDEIYITKLVGGGSVFIYGPFVIQGVIYSIIAFVLNVFVFYLLLKNLNNIVSENYGVLTISQDILLAEFVIFIIIGGVSGFLSSKKFLRQKIT